MRKLGVPFDNFILITERDYKRVQKPTGIYCSISMFVNLGRPPKEINRKSCCLQGERWIVLGSRCTLSCFSIMRLLCGSSYIHLCLHNHWYWPLSTGEGYHLRLWCWPKLADPLHSALASLGPLLKKGQRCTSSAKVQGYCAKGPWTNHWNLPGSASRFPHLFNGVNKLTYYISIKSN